MYGLPIKRKINIFLQHLNVFKFFDVGENLFETGHNKKKL